MRYGDVEFDPPLILAPMAGITDRQFRLVLRRMVTMGYHGRKSGRGFYEYGS